MVLAANRRALPRSRFPAHRTGVMIEKGAGLSIGIGGNIADLGRVGKSGSALPLEFPTESAEWFIDPTTDRYPTRHRSNSRFVIVALPLPGFVVVHSEVPANLLIH